MSVAVRPLLWPHHRVTPNWLANECEAWRIHWCVTADLNRFVTTSWPAQFFFPSASTASQINTFVCTHIRVYVSKFLNFFQALRIVQTIWTSAFRAWDVLCQRPLLPPPLPPRYPHGCLVQVENEHGVVPDQITRGAVRTQVSTPAATGGCWPGHDAASYGDETTRLASTRDRPAPRKASWTWRTGSAVCPARTRPSGRAACLSWQCLSPTVRRNVRLLCTSCKTDQLCVCFRIPYQASKVYVKIYWKNERGEENN